jgi:hypothetical protein
MRTEGYIQARYPGEVKSGPGVGRVVEQVMDPVMLAKNGTRMWMRRGIEAYLIVSISVRAKFEHRPVGHCHVPFPIG